MKNHLPQLFIASLLVILLGFQTTMAQEKKTSTISITIEQDDKVTTDTTFELAEGQDPELIKKIIMHLAGDDSHTVHVNKEMHMEEGHGEHGDMMFIGTGEDGEEKMNVQVIVGSGDMDCGKKEKNVKVIVHSDDDMEWVEKGEGDESVDVYMYKTEDGETVKIVKKKVKVAVEEDHHKTQQKKKQ
ncbi:hypothetical protein ACFLSP_02990 [Bacteroidota bacterium]